MTENRRPKIINHTGHIALADAEDMRVMDRLETNGEPEKETALMERAAYALYTAVMADERVVGCKSAVVLCGNGGNGGDGYALAWFLLETGIETTVLDVLGSEIKSSAAWHFRSRLDPRRIFSCVALTDASLEEKLSGAELIMDAVYGTGFRGELPEIVCRVFRAAGKSDAYKIAADIPSGVDCCEGSVTDGAFAADKTITFEFMKPGILSYPGTRYSGTVEAVSIGYKKSTAAYLENGYGKGFLLTKEYIAGKLPVRDAATHKGCFGRLLNISGSENMPGAACLSASGALRCGAGLIIMGVPRSIMPVLQARLVEPVYCPTDEDNLSGLHENISGADAILFGCGVGKGSYSDLLLTNVAKYAHGTIILDADGINAAARNINILKEIRAPKIITPHPAEMAKLLGVETADVERCRIGVSRRFASEYNCVVVLKGARTVIAAPNGIIYINPTGNPGMAKGGSGDVLAGMIASFVAQGISAVDSACIGVYMHGLAGDICSRERSEYGLLPSDLPDTVSKLLRCVRR